MKTATFHSSTITNKINIQECQHSQNTNITKSIHKATAPSTETTMPTTITTVNHRHKNNAMAQILSQRFTKMSQSTTWKLKQQQR